MLAVLLTYTSVAFHYTPDVIQMFQDKAKEEKPATAAQDGAKKDAPLSAGDVALGLLAIFAIAAAAPFLGGAKNILGLLIIAFGLFEAWKIAGKSELAITGPYSVTPTSR